MKLPDFGTLAAKYSNSEGKSESHSFTQVDNSRVGKSMSEAEHVELVLSRIRENHIDITQDEKDWVNCLLAMSTTFGEAGRDYAQQLSQFWVGKDKSYDPKDVDDKYDWCLKNGNGAITVATFMSIARDYGVDISMPPGRYPEGAIPLSIPKNAKKSGKEKEDEPSLPERVLNFLADVAEFRYNKISECIEVRNIHEGTPWVRMDDRIRDTLITKLHWAGIKVRKANFDSYIQSADFAPDFNPVEDYFKTLQPWDPSQPDYIGDYFDHIEFDESEEKAELYKKFARKWFLNFVALMKGQIPDNQLMLTFIGSQNVGKTYFCKHILPDTLGQFFHTIHPNDPLDKDQLIALSGYLLILFDEFRLSGKQSNSIKALLSTSETEIRGAYAHNPKKRKRRASFVATGNDDIYITDSQGARRYVSIKIKGTKNLHDYPLPYEGAYAQALYLISQKDFSHDLSVEDLKELEEINAEHIEEDLVAAAISSCFRKPYDDEQGIKVGCDDIMQEISIKLRNRKVESWEIGKAMKKLGFDITRPHNRVRYYVVKINPADYEESCRKEGEAYYQQLQQGQCEKECFAHIDSFAEVNTCIDNIFHSTAIEALYSDKEEDVYDNL